MGAEGERGKRAGDYILGLMGEAERERAERDMEVDAAFRDAVIELAERMHVFDHAEMPKAGAEGRWKLVAERIADLPQMRLAGMSGAKTAKPPAGSRAPRANSLRAIPNRRAFFVALGLIAAFVLGYLTSKL